MPVQIIKDAAEYNKLIKYVLFEIYCFNQKQNFLILLQIFQC